MEIKFENTQRGFSRAEFKDLYGAQCSIQKSSLADVDAIWLGCDSGSHYLGTKPVDEIEYTCAARMHLSRRQAWSLLLPLVWFALTGRLPRWGERKV